MYLLYRIHRQEMNDKPELLRDSSEIWIWEFPNVWVIPV